MCGGTGWRYMRPPRHSGLSPRVRGNPPRARLSAPFQRSIPACAGEPYTSQGGRIYTNGLSPRVRGNRRVLERCMTLTSLSPRVRGNRGAAYLRRERVRSIPACAGEPPQRENRQLVGGVYPRVCGGTVQFMLADARVAGLSPRVRGNQLVCLVEVLVRRSIPACAGEPSSTTPAS